MTQREWLNCQQPKSLLVYLDSRSAPRRRRFWPAGWWPVPARRSFQRKLRLFACGCCRRVWDVLDVPSRAKVEVAERYADDRATAAELGAAGAGPVAAGPSWATRYGAAAAVRVAAAELGGNVEKVATCARYALLAGADGAAESEAQLALFHDLFRNPFRPPPVLSPERPPAAVTLATAIYTDRRFEAMPALADALAQSGCTDADVLGHCRTGAAHARGCWVLDLVLGAA